MSNWKSGLLTYGALGVLAFTSLSPVSAQTSSPTPKSATMAKADDDVVIKNRKQAYVLYMEAQRLKSLRTTKVNELVTLYKDIIRLDPQAAEAHADLGELYFFNLRQFETAEQEGLESIRIDADCLSGRRLLARLYVVSARFDQNPKPAQIDRAIRAYDEVARIDPTNVEAWGFLAELHDMKNDVAQQIKALEKLSGLGAPTPMDAYFYRQVMNTELSPDRTFYQLSRLYLDQTKYPQAIETARRAFELDPESAVNAKNLMDALRFSASGEEELNSYTRLIRRTGSPLLQVGYSAALIRAGRFSEAIARLREAVKAEPENASIIDLLAIAQRRSGKRSEAIETLKTALPKLDFAARQKLGMALAETYEENGQTQDAIAYYEGIFNDLANKPRLTAAENDLFGSLLSRLTRAYGRQGEKKKAQDALTRARAVLGENSLAIDALLIENLREEGKPREALVALRAIAPRFPAERSLKLTEGAILSELQNYGESLETLRGLLKGENANDTSVLSLISSVEMQSGQFKEAEATIRQAIKVDPNDADLLIQLGSIQDRSGQKVEAEKTLRTILQREPDNATALNNLGYFLAERSARYQEALPLIEKAVSIEPLNGSFWDSLGWVHYKMGRLQDARMHLEKALRYTRRNATVYEHLGDVLRDLGRGQEAKINWERALEYSVEAGAVARLRNKIKDTQ